MGKCFDIDHKYIMIIYRLYTDYNHAVIVSSEQRSRVSLSCSLTRRGGDFP